MKKRKFHQVYPDLTKNPPGLIFENEKDFLEPNQEIFGGWDVRKRGFPKFSGYPRLIYNRKNGRRPQDIENFSRFWLITSRTKAVFETIDPQAFQFVPCEVIIDDNHSVGEYWICDVIRVLDAVNEETSKIGISYSKGRKIYSLMGWISLNFKEEIVCSYHIFCMKSADYAIICDDILRQACKAAKLKSFMFMPVDNMKTQRGLVK